MDVSIDPAWLGVMNKSQPGLCYAWQQAAASPGLHVSVEYRDQISASERYTKGPAETLNSHTRCNFFFHCVDS